MDSNESDTAYESLEEPSQEPGTFDSIRFDPHRNNSIEIREK